VKLLIYSLIALSLLGCASSPYIEPSVGTPVAYLTYRTVAAPTLGYTALMLEVNDKKSRGCFASRRAMANVNDGNPLDSKTNNPKKIKVPANTKFTASSIFIPAHVGGQTGCRLNVTFAPKEGESYILETSWENSCVTKVYVDEDGKEIEIKSEQDSFSC
jgi:hypothetical protein